jgi:hypothetical protein
MKRNNSIGISFTGYIPQKLLTSNIKREKFVDLMKGLQQIDKDRYVKVANTVEKGFEKLDGYKGKKVIDLIEKNAFPEVKEIPVGSSGLYNFVTRLADSVILPAKLVAKGGKSISKRFTDQPPAPPVKKELTPVFVKNSLNLVEKAKKAVIGSDEKITDKLTQDPELIDKLKATYGEFLSELLTGNKAKYDNSKENVYFKLTGLVSVPFLVMEAYNVTLKEQGNKVVATQKAQERAAQDLTRQAFSSYIVAVINNLSREFFNSSLLNAALVTICSVTGYESLTRKSVGMPILPKTKTEIEEIDEKNFNKKGLSAVYFRLMSRLTGKKPLSSQIAKSGDVDKKLEQSLLLNNSNDYFARLQSRNNNNHSQPTNPMFNTNNSLIPERFKAKTLK